MCVLRDVELHAAQTPSPHLVDPPQAQVYRRSAEEAHRIRLDRRVVHPERDTLPRLGPEQGCLRSERPAQRTDREVETDDTCPVELRQQLVSDRAGHERFLGGVAGQCHRCLDSFQACDAGVGEGAGRGPAAVHLTGRDRLHQIGFRFGAPFS